MEPLCGDDPISYGEYQRLYKEAVHVARERYGNVGTPYYVNGARFCDVRGIPRDDYGVFALCWSEEMAVRIGRARNAGRRETEHGVFSTKTQSSKRFVAVSLARSQR